MYYTVITSDLPLLREGAVDFNTTSSDQKVMFEEVMHRLRERASQRRVLAKPCFQDFDRYVCIHF